MSGGRTGDTKGIERWSAVCPINPGCAPRLSWRRARPGMSAVSAFPAIRARPFAFEARLKSGTAFRVCSQLAEDRRVGDLVVIDEHEGFRHDAGSRARIYGMMGQIDSVRRNKSLRRQGALMDQHGADSGAALSATETWFNLAASIAAIRRMCVQHNRHARQAGPQHHRGNALRRQAEPHGVARKFAAQLSDRHRNKVYRS